MYTINKEEKKEDTFGKLILIVTKQLCWKKVRQRGHVGSVLKEFLLIKYIFCFVYLVYSLLPA